MGSRLRGTCRRRLVAAIDEASRARLNGPAGRFARRPHCVIIDSFRERKSGGIGTPRSLQESSDRELLMRSRPGLLARAPGDRGHRVTGAAGAATPATGPALDPRQPGWLPARRPQDRPALERSAAGGDFHRRRALASRSVPIRAPGGRSPTTTGSTSRRSRTPGRYRIRFGDDGVARVRDRNRCLCRRARRAARLHEAPALRRQPRHRQEVPPARRHRHDHRREGGPRRGLARRGRPAQAHDHHVVLRRRPGPGRGEAARRRGPPRCRPWSRSCTPRPMCSTSRSATIATTCRPRRSGTTTGPTMAGARVDHGRPGARRASPTVPSTRTHRPAWPAWPAAARRRWRSWETLDAARSFYRWPRPTPARPCRSPFDLPYYYGESTVLRRPGMGGRRALPGNPVSRPSSTRPSPTPTRRATTPGWARTGTGTTSSSPTSTSPTGGCIRWSTPASSSGWPAIIARGSSGSANGPSGTRTAIGTPLVWCSTNDVIAFATQARLYEMMTGDARFRGLAAEARDWIFGRNPWGVSFVIGVPKGGVAASRPAPPLLQAGPHAAGGRPGRRPGDAPDQRGPQVLDLRPRSAGPLPVGCGRLSRRVRRLLHQRADHRRHGLAAAASGPLVNDRRDRDNESEYDRRLRPLGGGPGGRRTRAALVPQSTVPAGRPRRLAEPRPRSGSRTACSSPTAAAFPGPRSSTSSSTTGCTSST